MTAPPRRGPGWIEWITLVLICGCAALCGLLELMFVPLYAGAVILPVSIVAAVASNLALPYWGFRLIGSAKGAILPVLAWLIVILALSLVTRPEGDLFVIAAHYQQWNFYGMLLFGATAGFGVIVRLTTPRLTVERAPAKPAARPSRPSPGGRPGGGGKGKRVNR